MIIKSQNETSKNLHEDTSKFTEERDELVEDKANMLHDLLEEKEQKAKLEMEVNHLESETRELFAMNIANVISDVQKDVKLRHIEAIIRS